MKNYLLLILLMLSFSALCQDQYALVLTDDAKYFNFWEGTWYLVKDDQSVDTTFYFKVKQSVHPAAFVEEWKFGAGSVSVALRAWDKTNAKWGFVWVSGNGLYQVWDTRKVDGHWYIYKEFNVNGDKYLSRQSFKLQPDGTVLRLSEKSYDDKTWEVRFKQSLRKVQ